MLSPFQAIALLFAFASVSLAQSFTSSDPGYAGYSLGLTGDDRNSAVYETDSTDTANTSLTTPPDVYLNASVSVEEIQIIVQNLSAKVNLDAQVLSLLDFNAGVDVSIAKVNLTIENITAKVLLEARLGNLKNMISDVLDSIDLNPVIASLGSDLTDIADGAGSALNDTASSLRKKSTGSQFDLDNNILYSINDYSGNTHTNRILAQDGSVIDQSLNNDGDVTSQRTVGNFSTLMSFTGYNVSTTFGGQSVRQLEYGYSPFGGLSIVSAVFVSGEKVVGTRVLSESGAGGSSSIGDYS